jgi:hypothetical protein
VVKPVKDIISTYFKKHADWQWRLLELWPEVVGQMREHVFLEKVYKETVVIGVYHSSWMHELHMLSPVLIDKINSVFDRPRIKRIRFKLKGQKMYNQAKTGATINLRPTVPAKLSTGQRDALKGVEDVELAKHLEKFFGKCQTEKDPNEKRTRKRVKFS